MYTCVSSVQGRELKREGWMDGGERYRDRDRERKNACVCVCVCVCV